MGNDNDSECFLCRDEIELSNSNYTSTSSSEETRQETLSIMLCQIFGAPDLGKEIYRFGKIRYCTPCSNTILNVKSLCEELESVEKRVLVGKTEIVSQLKEKPKHTYSQRNLDLDNDQIIINSYSSNQLRNEILNVYLNSIKSKSSASLDSTLETLKTVKHNFANQKNEHYHIQEHNADFQVEQIEITNNSSQMKFEASENEAYILNGPSNGDLLEPNWDFALSYSMTKMGEIGQLDSIELKPDISEDIHDIAVHLPISTKLCGPRRGSGPVTRRKRKLIDKDRDHSDNKIQTEKIPHKKIVYKCLHCDRVFKSTLAKNTHQKTHRISYKCQHCDKSYICKKDLTMHEQIHELGKHLKCRFCEKQFKIQTRLKYHEREHKGLIPYKCRYCELAFTKIRKLRNHEGKHTGVGPYKCHQCGKIFGFLTALRSHEMIHTGEKPYKCRYCEKSFNQCTNFKKHEATHKKKPDQEKVNAHICSYCGQTFSTPEILKIHEVVHKPESLHRCKYCAKAYPRKGDIISHERTHTGEKPFLCQFCEKTFSASRYLKRHEIRHTNQVNEKFKCNFCNVTCVSQDKLKIHERVHTAEKPFKCQDCGKAFVCSSHLYAHERYVHKAEKRYNCKDCEKMFSCKKTMKVHKCLIAQQ